MKLLLTVLFLIVSFSIKAQTDRYHTFPDSNAVWRQEAGYSNGSAGFHWKDEFYLDGDTTVNAVDYVKIHKKRRMENILFGFCFPIISSTSFYYEEYAGAIREDSTQKNVYVLLPGDSSDALLYTFNLNTGDTLPPSINHGTLITVIGTDSIFDGYTYRKQLNLSSSASLIEGVGSTFGLLSNIDMPFEGFDVLHCFLQNDTTLYSDNCFMGCDAITGVNTLTTNKELKIYPNPLHTKATIEFSVVFESPDLIIYDYTGKELNHYYKISSPFEVTRENLDNGIYFFHLTGKQGNVFFGKFIIE